jgi:hypothetical protein
LLVRQSLQLGGEHARDERQYRVVGEAMTVLKSLALSLLGAAFVDG